MRTRDACWSVLTNQRRARHRLAAMVYGMVQRHSAELKLTAQWVGTTVRLIFADGERRLTQLNLPAFPFPRISGSCRGRDRCCSSLRDALEGDGHTLSRQRRQEDRPVRAALNDQKHSRGDEDLGMLTSTGVRWRSVVKAFASTPVVRSLAGASALAEGDVPCMWICAQQAAEVTRPARGMSAAVSPRMSA